MLVRYKKNAEDNSCSFVLENANLVLVNKDVMIKEQYQNILKTKFLATILKEDFNNNELVTDRANKWVKEHTHNMIPKLLNEPLDPETSMAVFNAIYFKGEWVNPFRHYLTSDAKFWKNGIEEVEVKTMYKSSINVNYTDNQHLHLKVSCIHCDPH